MYEPTGRVRSGWILIIAGLALAAVAALSLRPVCRPDAAGVDEAGFGVRHHQRGTAWYHCEPWIRQALTR